MIRRVFLAFLVFGLVNLAGCGDGGTDPPVAATVTLSSTTLSFGSFGETQQLTTTVLDGNGATISSASVTGSPLAHPSQAFRPRGSLQR